MWVFFDILVIWFFRYIYIYFFYGDICIIIISLIDKNRGGDFKCLKISIGCDSFYDGILWFEFKKKCMWK